MALSTTSTPLTSAGTAPYLGTSQHPHYIGYYPIWRLLADAVEGAGGFADGTYLVAHPREWQDHASDNPTKPTKKLLERRKLARYENWPDTILTLIGGGLFRKKANRICGATAGKEGVAPHPVELWWKNYDGQGTTAHDWYARHWRSAATFGHLFVVIDRAENVAQTAADMPPQYVRVYAPLDVPDWLTDDQGALVAISALEALPRKSFDNALPDVQNRWIFADRWELHTAPGAKTQPTEDNRKGDLSYGGKLPVVVLYAKRRALTPVIGQSVLGDPYLAVDDYNLTSEVRELLRKQTFSWINVPLGTGDAATSVETAQTMMGGQVSAGNVLFTPLEAQMLSGDTANVTVYQQERDHLQRTMFRLAGLPWEGDSRAAESAESRRLKREDLNQTLAAYADQCERAELELTELFFRGQYGERWREEWDKAQITIDWPDTFDSEVLDDVINRATLAIGLGMGKTAENMLRKQIAMQMLPALPADVKSAVEAEIDALPTGEEQAQAIAEGRMQRLMGGRQTMQPQPDDSPDPEQPDPEDDPEDDPSDDAQAA